ncbi:MAG: DNA-processing protein DprA [Rhizobiaceae bacterium]|jgi:DNA processing protein|nr:DNA-processing protein DprA [Rhizobiaceae bacterium]
MEKAHLRLSDEQRFHWLRLIRTERIGPVTFRQLISRYGSARLALEALPEIAARSGATRGLQAAPLGDIEREFDTARRMGARFVALGEPEYPAALAQTENAPPLLAVAGDPSPLQRPQIAIVGSRNASTNGLKFARELAADLAGQGVGVTSGLARGIDRAAHEGALARGVTVAVLAGGLDMPYPPQNIDVLERIVGGTGGCAVSVMPFGHEPQARDFPRRNAIIAGLSLGVVVVEASDKSGSLITANMATEIGRMVFAVPGHPVDPRSHGTNGLIRQGADLVRNAADVLDVMRPLMAGPVLRPVGGAPVRPPETATQSHLPSAPSASQAGDARGRVPKPGSPLPPPASQTPPDPVDHVAGLLGTAPTHVDDLIRESGLPAPKVHAALLDLELAGRIGRGSGGVVFLVS